MNELLKMILSLSLSGALLILILLLCKPVIKNKLSKRWQYYIWLIVVARLLLPVATETNLMGTLFQNFDNSVIQTNEYLQSQQSNPALPKTDSAVHDKRTGTAGGEYTKPEKLLPGRFHMALQNIGSICLLIWFIVAVGLMIRRVTVYQSFIKYIKAGRREVSDLALWEQIGTLAEQTGVRRAVGLYTNSLISSPLLIGFFHPCIMLPTTELSDSDLQYTILHELAHYRRRDLFYKWLVQFAVCLHWFNPLVHIMSREINRACELSCDEAVIRTLAPEGRRAYGDTLLNAMGAGGSYHDARTSVTLYESAKLLKERLDAIMKFRKTSKLTSAVMIVLTLVTVVGAADIGAYAAAPKPMSDHTNTVSMPQTPVNNNSRQSSTSSSGILPEHTKEIALSFDIYNGGIKILHAASNEIKASYDSEYYHVTITDNNGTWAVAVTGKAAMMGKTDDVRIYIPDLHCTMDVNVLDGNFSYPLPDNCADIINLTAKNSGVDFTSKNQFKNSNISLTAANKDFIKYEPPVFPNYFTKTDTGFEYTNGTESNRINIRLTGYTSVVFAEANHNDTEIKANDMQTSKMGKGS